MRPEKFEITREEAGILLDVLGSGALPRPHTHQGDVLVVLYLALRAFFEDTP